MELLSKNDSDDDLSRQVFRFTRSVKIENWDRLTHLYSLKLRFANKTYVWENLVVVVYQFNFEKTRLFGPRWDHKFENASIFK